MTDILSALSEEDREYVLSRMVRFSLKKGEPLFSEGDSGTDMYIVLSGAVAVSVADADGGELTLSEIGPGGFFGEMSLVEDAPRSATCRLIEDGELLKLGGAAFEEIMRTRPAAAAKVLAFMLAVTTERLRKTGGFLSRMVQWGEASRKRAITDEATNLFNRRFFDQSYEELFRRARIEGKPFAFAMFDLDRFGSLNRAYGSAFGDAAVVEVAACMKRSFAPEDYVIRYGGDEFVFLFPGADSTRAVAKARALIDAVRLVRVPGYPDVRLTCSIGVASAPEHAADCASLREEADRALYAAKEAGRDRAAAPSGTLAKTTKTRMPSIAARNRAIAALARALDERDGFLVVGHQNPDEDCLGAMTAVSLLAVKLGKHVAMLVPRRPPKQFDYLLSICAFNGIAALEAVDPSKDTYSTIIAVDTPKPSMIDMDEGARTLAARPATLRMEIDHHLETDAEYFGDEGYRLVDQATSACELIGFLAYKIGKNEFLRNKYSVETVFSRNLVLALLTGIIGDSGLGKYLKTARERRLYGWMIGQFERMLERQTRKDSGNFISKEQIFAAIASLSAFEEDCLEKLMAHARSTPRLDYIALTQETYAAIKGDSSEDPFVSVVKTAADTLAERNGTLGMVAYPDQHGLLQIRIRRCRRFDAFDLRSILDAFSIENGGGHPGAIGFRLPIADIPDPVAYCADFAERLTALIDAGRAT